MISEDNQNPVHPQPSFTSTAATMPYSIEISTLPADIKTTRPWRTRVRKALASFLKEHVFPIDDYLKNQDYEQARSRWEQFQNLSTQKTIISTFFLQRFSDLSSNPLALDQVSINIDWRMDQNPVIHVSWTTKEYANKQHEKNRQAIRKSKKILQMRRLKDPPEDWGKYLRLKTRWPDAKKTPLFPLEDPDTVRQQKEIYQPMVLTLRQMTANNQNQSQDSMVKVWLDYMETCLTNS